ncbi:MAG: type II toxin-antitoxin system VapC family toxin [Rhodopirellula sp.]|nr:type II toxin-antitoxin system VapC family toxin [Rhodopirellula sp.]
MRYILDSSTAFKWVIPEHDSDIALRLRAEFQAAVHELLAPDIFPGEVAHALTRAERQARITPGEALDLWSNVMTTAPQLVPSLPLMHRAIAISSQTLVGVFDCLYVALAEREGCEFITADSRAVNGLQRQFPFVVALSSL